MRKHRSIFTIFILGFEFNSDAIKKLQGDNNELVIIPGAVHTDLYYKMNVISFDKIGAFYYEVFEIKSEAITRVCDSLTFFYKSVGKTDIERGIMVLQLYGKPACHL